MPAIVDAAARYIGAAAVVSWMHIFAPDRIAFAGGLSAAGEDLLSTIRETVSHLAMADYVTKVTILAGNPRQQGRARGCRSSRFADSPNQQAP
jgi:predicted NBD/HSP70 family sugar kinase